MQFLCSNLAIKPAMVSSLAAGCPHTAWDKFASASATNHESKLATANRAYLRQEVLGPCHPGCFTVVSAVTSSFVLTRQNDYPLVSPYCGHNSLIKVKAPLLCCMRTMRAAASARAHGLFGRDCVCGGAVRLMMMLY